MKRIYLVPLAVIFFYSCDIFSEDEPKKVNPEGLLKNARSFSYLELPDSIRKNAHDAYSYASLGEKSDELKKEDGYYVQVILDNTVLANVSTKDTNWRALIDSNNYRALYGKYRNHPLFYNATGGLVRQTLKHEMYNLFHIGRNGNIDTAYWGPLFERPVRMRLTCSYLDSARQPVMAVH